MDGVEGSAAGVGGRRLCRRSCWGARLEREVWVSLVTLGILNLEGEVAHLLRRESFGLRDLATGGGKGRVPATRLSGPCGGAAQGVPLSW